MPAFEITALGFGDATDGTDEREARLLWVWCPEENWLRESLKGAYHESMSKLDYSPTDLPPDRYDFIMPKDVQALHDRLRELAGIPRLDQMVRGANYIHPEHGRMTFIASDPDDGAYLICKYWDTDKDEQAYIGCEASDLRFLPTTENQKP